jgi:alpha-ketoglutarate-dependent taurine dioxygenase
MVPADPGVDLAVWLAAHRELVEALVLDVGGILFRGFGVTDAEDFARTSQAFGSTLLEYTYRSTPRSQELGRIYTSTEYPPDQEILLHNENSYTRRWPLRLWFCCAREAASGGETPVADSRSVLRRIDSSLRRRLEQTGVMYIRNYSDVVDLPWQEVFQTTDPVEVDEYCAAAGIEAVWSGGSRLQTRQVAQAISTHPRSGASVWFNQAHLFHPSGLPEELRDTLLELMSEDELPRNACYGDGTPFAEDELAEIRAAYEAEAVDVQWAAGDVLLLDNMLAAHGRRRFTPPRKVLVAMAEEIQADDAVH